MRSRKATQSDDFHCSCETSRLTILIPVFDEWGAASQLLRALDNALAQSDWRAYVLVADDGSNDDVPADLLPGPMWPSLRSC